MHSTTSAGGIVFRIEKNYVEVLVVKRLKNVETKWLPVLCQLPKGGVEAKETLHEAAQREVFEETGYETLLLDKAGVASWTYERGGKIWIETVHYYFMRPKTRTPTLHDDEFDEVSWIHIDGAEAKLSYPEEKRLIKMVREQGFPSA